ncbi:MAG: hypothetical protein Q4A29_05965 [Eubacteriales bacterium]|nr:hypothetical protein [Eubacteriales bacterium]
MNSKRVLHLILAVLFIALNVSVLVSALFGSPVTTFLLFGASFAAGVILFFLLRYHRNETERRKQIQELEEKEKNSSKSE